MGPSRAWYGLAVGLVVAGIGLFGWTLFRGVRQVVDASSSFQRVVVPGGGEVRLDEPGEYKVFYEPVTRFQGQSFNTPQPMPSMKVTLTRLEDGKAIPMQSTTANEVYHINQTKGVSKWWFEADKPGKYRVDGDYPANKSGGNGGGNGGGRGGGQGLVLAVGQFSVWSMLTSVFGIFGGAAAMIFGFIAGLCIFLIVLFKRKRTAREAADKGA